jgi:hypothetical protein
MENIDLLRFMIFNPLLDFIRAWDFGNTEILKLFFYESWSKNLSGGISANAALNI